MMDSSSGIARSDPIWDSKVLGEWAKAIKSLSLPTFKHVTILELPIIFVASLDDIMRPVEGEIWYVNGSDESCRKIRTVPLDEIRRVDNVMAQGNVPRERVNTMTNDRASWLRLLEVLQLMERDSISWDFHEWRRMSVPRPQWVGRISLAVGVQPYKCVFESTSMFRRPYATTTISHLIELAAILGLYWKQFDRGEDKYRAEGNGLSLRGMRIENLGLVFTFEQVGCFKFEENRVIPTSDVKELCFGNAPTFYRPGNSSEDVAWQDAATTRRQITLMTLRLGSQQDLSATLALIGCNRKTVSHFLTPESKQSHLFPVVFEIMGMLCRTCHIRSRCFTYLPNPTMHFWNRRELSLRRLLSAFKKYLRTAIDEFPWRVPADMSHIYFIAHELNSQLPEGDQQPSPIELKQLLDALSKIEIMLREGSTPKAIVLDVVRRHLQELMQAVNEPDGEEKEILKPIDEEVTNEPKHPRIPRPSFKTLDLLPPEYREHELMRVYFSEIRQRVVSVASQVTGAGPFDSQDEAGDASLEVHVTSDSGDTHDDNQTPPTGAHTKTPLAAIYDRRNIVWCALVLRMICWLLLHDFDEQDIQLPKSELQGSHLPVYIQ
ncbi:hypothetical protein F5Y10DRAFT_276924 [Nemania abortiva]|nr:hypothetical protein F5Y10DRAFT_276924 [Nemania abortiva]